MALICPWHPYNKPSQIAHSTQNLCNVQFGWSGQIYVCFLVVWAGQLQLVRECNLREGNLRGPTVLKIRHVFFYMCLEVTRTIWNSRMFSQRRKTALGWRHFAHFCSWMQIAWLPICRRQIYSDSHHRARRLTGPFLTRDRGTPGNQTLFATNFFSTKNSPQFQSHARF